ncbi:hypothetical protein DPMN_050171 [Dreissena polymorpha]|uniref:Uncharacterized protein n=1 Tax=Dreissena polymorpha TaxID=45954 RepID=A0A9D4CHB1_DREPO|nr:hypothetical protein DPMN_050171 [Dreissena polymorpha]
MLNAKQALGPGTEVFKTWLTADDEATSSVLTDEEIIKNRRTDVTANEVIDWLDANTPPSAVETKTQLRAVVRQEDTTTTSTTTTTSSSSRSANTLTTSHSQVNSEVAVAGANITATATPATSMTAGGNNDDDEEYETPPEGNTSGQAKNGGKKKNKRKSKGANAASKSSNEGATAQQTENLDPAAIQKENERLRDMQTCKICIKRPVGTTLLPCGLTSEIEDIVTFQL